MKLIVAILSLYSFGAITRGTEFHVATSGSNTNPGTSQSPFGTIQHAADVAQPGDIVTVQEGVYRERINPPRGGSSDAMRITYQAARGEKVVITGAERATGWTKEDGDVWKLVLPNTFFGAFNPYTDLIHGDWFGPKGRQHHTGCVYLNGDWMMEAVKLDDVMKSADNKSPLWFGQVDATNTTIWAQFKGVDPNEQLVEINKRQTVFYPEKTGINYLTVRGFTMKQAATPWAPPTAEQIGVIGTHWSKGWIIENNEISYSKCCGIALGKYGDEWDNRANSPEGYVGTIKRATDNGWNKETIGHHMVRNNDIHDCEQAGVVGSLGCSFSTVIGNNIHEIHVHRLFSGEEMAGIKFHGAIDVEISHNHIYRTCLGIWLDWMAQGTHVTGNLFHDNDRDLMCEVDHGPFLVDNNLFLSRASYQNVSQGGAFVHNLITGVIKNFPRDPWGNRKTPYLVAHSTEIAGMSDNPCGDHRIYNNLFVPPCSASAFDNSQLPCFAAGNVFIHGAKPSRFDISPLLKPDFDPALKLVEEKDGYYLEITLDDSWAVAEKRQVVTTAILGNTAISKVPFENADGSPLKINTDYFGKPRGEDNPFPGPFEISKGGKLRLKVW